MHSSFVLTFVASAVATDGAATAGELSGAAIAATVAGAPGAAGADTDVPTFAAATAAGAREAECDGVSMGARVSGAEIRPAAADCGCGATAASVEGVGASGESPTAGAGCASGHGVHVIIVAGTAGASTGLLVMDASATAGEATEVDEGGGSVAVAAWAAFARSWCSRKHLLHMLFVASRPKNPQPAAQGIGSDEFSVDICEYSERWRLCRSEKRADCSGQRASKKSECARTWAGPKPILLLLAVPGRSPTT